jgi:hypothetical protein
LFTLLRTNSMTYNDAVEAIARGFLQRSHNEETSA